MIESAFLLIAGVAVYGLALLAVVGGLFLVRRFGDPEAGRFVGLAAAANFLIALALGFAGFVLIAVAVGGIGD